MKNKYIIGICGGSSSGKSYLSGILKEKLKECNYKIKVMHMDDYYITEIPKSKSIIDDKLYNDFDAPESFNIKKLLDDVKNIEAEVVIIEGLLTFYIDKIREILDFKIYVECDEDIRLLRISKKDFPCDTSSIDILNQYINLVKTRHLQYIKPTKYIADVIINGMKVEGHGTDVLSAGLKSLINMQFESR